jgi:hypothetical protein
LSLCHCPRAMIPQQIAEGERSGRASLQLWPTGPACADATNSDVSRRSGP